MKTRFFEKITHVLSGILLVIFTLRFLLILLGANKATAFFVFIAGMTDFVILPLQAILPDFVFSDTFRAELSSLVIILLIGLLTIAGTWLSQIYSRKKSQSSPL